MDREKFLTTAFGDEIFPIVFFATVTEKLINVVIQVKIVFGNRIIVCY